MPETDEAEIRAAVDALLELHGEALEKAVQIDPVSVGIWPAGMTIESQPKRRWTSRNPGAPASLAEFIVEVAPNGKTTRAWLVDSYPDASFGEELAGLVRKTRYSKTDSGRIRYGLRRYIDRGRAGYSLDHRTTIRRRAAGQTL